MMWLKINNEWHECAWLCADTGIDIVKKGITISGNGCKVSYKGEDGKEHAIHLIIIKTKERVDPISNQIIPKC